MVYVDSAFLPFRRMLMCHMIADTEEELEAMAKTIGVQLKWWQYKGTYKSHFDICSSKRDLAIKAGAIVIDKKKLSELLKGKRNAITPL
jgi:hypothetical protein